MRKLLLSALVAFGVLFAVPAIASADALCTVTQDGNQAVIANPGVFAFYCDANGNLDVDVRSVDAKTSLTTASATVCAGAGGGAATYLIGVVNNSLSAQTATVLIYDNASAASGTVAASIGPLAVSQVITYPAPGIPLANGCTGIASAAPGGSGIQILTR